MYRIAHFTAWMKLADYVGGYRHAERFLAYCKPCKRYGACWSCPPFDFDTEEYLSAYERVYLIGTKIVLHERTIAENRGIQPCMKTAHDILEKVRPGLDEKLLELERRYPASRAFFAGTCHVCPADVCTRIEGEACLFPEKVRPSLESFGFDIGRTASELLHIELKWSQDGVLPEYFTLVSGFLTQDIVPEFGLLDEE
jgi:predicted metal-binding protein